MRAFLILKKLEKKKMKKQKIQLGENNVVNSYMGVMI